MRKYFEDFEVGESVTTHGRTITEADIVLHAGQTGDFYPHHMDAVFAADQSFGQRIAHGTLVMSVAVGMLAKEVNSVAFSYGYDRVRFIKPVFIGDTITPTATIASSRSYEKDAANFGLVDEHVEVKNQRGETVMVLTHVYLIQKKASGLQVGTP